MSAQGVPSFIAISREVRNFRAHYDATCQRVDSQIQQLSSEIGSRFDALPEALVAKMLDRIEVDGVRPYSLTEIRETMLELLGASGGPISHIRDSILRLSEQQSSMMTRLESGGTVSTLPGQDLHNTGAHIQAFAGMIHHWPSDPGHMHMVPEGFKFPSYVASTMWRLWFFGNASLRVGPYKSISALHDLPATLCKTNKSRTKKIIDKVIEIAVDGLKIGRPNDITVENSDEVFEYAMPQLMALLYDAVHYRPAEININTLYNRMSSQKP